MVVVVLCRHTTSYDLLSVGLTILVRFGPPLAAVRLSQASLRASIRKLEVCPSQNKTEPSSKALKFLTCFHDVLLAIRRVHEPQAHASKDAVSQLKTMPDLVPWRKRGPAELNAGRTPCHAVLHMCEESDYSGGYMGSTKLDVRGFDHSLNGVLWKFERWLGGMHVF